MSLLLDALKQAEQVKTKEVFSGKDKTHDVLRSANAEEPVSQDSNNSPNDDEVVLKSQLSKELPFDLEMDSAGGQIEIDGYGDEFPLHHAKGFSVSVEEDPYIELVTPEKPEDPSVSGKHQEKIEDQPGIDIPEKPVDQPIPEDRNASVTEKPFPLANNEVIGASETGDRKRAEDVLKVTQNSNWNRASVVLVGLVVLMFGCAGGYFYLLEQLPEPVAMPSTGVFNPIANDSFGSSHAKPPGSVIVDSSVVKNH